MKVPRPDTNGENRNQMPGTREDNLRHSFVALDDFPVNLKAALGYWQSLGGERLSCAWRDFELVEIPAEVLPSTLVIDVFDDQSQNRFRYWGSAMTELHGRDMTGMSPYEINPADMVPELRRQHDETRRSGKASASCYAFQRDPGFEHIHYALRLPLSDDGRNVSQIVVVTESIEAEADDGAVAPRTFGPL